MGVITGACLILFIKNAGEKTRIFLQPFMKSHLPNRFDFKFLPLFENFSTLK